jgi:thiamine pyrophosphate-dependent acetolactate synthase large subunit-like protein
MAQIQKAADLINKSKRPIFYVGQGASHCPEIVAKVAKKSERSGHHDMSRHGHL